MKEVKAFVTSDGTLFGTLTAAQEHENKISLQPYIKKFLESDACEYKKGPYYMIVNKSIVAWTKWMKENS